jgi:hypothetical protein
MRGRVKRGTERGSLQDLDAGRDVSLRHSRRSPRVGVNQCSRLHTRRHFELPYALLAHVC